MTFNRQSFLDSAYKSLKCSVKARAVALALGHMSDFAAPSVPYSVPALQDYTGLSRASVQRALRELEQCGFLVDPVTTGRTTRARLANGKRILTVVPGSPDMWAQHFRKDAGIWTVSAEWVLRCAPRETVARLEAENHALGVRGVPVVPDLLGGPHTEAGASQSAERASL